MMPLLELISMPPVLVGSGKFGTPCERMHWENLSASWKCFWTVDPGGMVVAVPPAWTVVDVFFPRLATPLPAGPPQPATRVLKPTRVITRERRRPDRRRRLEGRPITNHDVVVKKSSCAR